MKMADEKEKTSGRGKVAAILLGVVDVLAAALLVFALVLRPEEGEVVNSNLSQDFAENADTYYDVDTDKSFSSTAVVSYESGQGAGQGTGGNGDGTTDTEGSRYDGFVFPNSDTELLTDAQIQEKIQDAEICRRAVNEIYARHGYAFTKQENIDYFNTYDWYKDMTKESDMNVVSSQFSVVEKTNVEKLQAYENSKGWS